jgi:hypothetical protein
MSGDGIVGVTIIWVLGLIGWSWLAVIVRVARQREAKKVALAEQDRMERLAVQNKYRRLMIECEALDKHCEFLATRLLSLLQEMARDESTPSLPIDQWLWSVSGTLSVLRWKRLARSAFRDTSTYVV